MISYLDKAFCRSNVKTHTCGRELTEEHKERARKWWGSNDYPVSYAYFCEEKEES